MSAAACQFATLPRGARSAFTGIRAGPDFGSPLAGMRATTSETAELRIACAHCGAATEYKRRIENRIREIVENHPTIEAILHGVDVTDLQLVALERTLHEELSAPELRASPKNLQTFLHRAFNGSYEL